LNRVFIAVLVPDQGKRLSVGAQFGQSLGTVSSPSDTRISIMTLTSIVLHPRRDSVA